MNPSARTVPGLVRLVVTVAVAAVATACGSAAGAVACSEFMAIPHDERVAVFVDAVEDRGLRLAGPQCQIEMQSSIAGRYCMQQPSATLDDGLDPAGVARRG